MSKDIGLTGQVIDFPRLPIHTDEADIEHFLSHGLNKTPEQARDFLERFREWLASTDAEWDQDMVIEVDVDTLLTIQEMANKLLRIMDDDTHILLVTRDGFEMQHPVSCRPDLLGCQVWKHQTEKPWPKLGRFAVHLDEAGNLTGHEVRP